LILLKLGQKVFAEENLQFSRTANFYNFAEKTLMYVILKQFCKKTFAVGSFEAILRKKTFAVGNFETSFYK